MMALPLKPMAPTAASAMPIALLLIAAGADWMPVSAMLACQAVEPTRDGGARAARAGAADDGVKLERHGGETLERPGRRE
jgi:hypothetical protein